MKLRDILKRLEEERVLCLEEKPISAKYELASHIYKSGERPTLFTRVEGKNGSALSGICSRREYLAMGLGVSVKEMLPRLAHAFENPTSPQVVSQAPCQEEITDRVDLDTLPIPHFFPKDGGPYITAGIMIVKDPQSGLNASYHRLMQIGKTSFAIRMVESRQAHTTYLKSGCHMEVAVCLGNSAAVLLASSMSPDSGVFELDIANTLDPTPLVKCRTKDLLVPADCEVVLEGRVTGQQLSEGPFVDLTGTYDFVRQQAVLEIDCITFRKDPYFQVLLPGQHEHKLLMGMPKEPSIFSYVNRQVECKNVVLTNGGGCWLHAAVQIRKRNSDDGKKAIRAAFEAHPSLKHVIVVDEDIDVYDPNDLEWAFSTRFQGDKGLLVLENQPSSSLDPSARHMPGEKSKTTKLGFDATFPDLDHKEKFMRVSYVDKLDLRE